jgi:hypothetical protein
MNQLYATKYIEHMISFIDQFLFSNQIIQVIWIKVLFFKNHELTILVL